MWVVKLCINKYYNSYGMCGSNGYFEFILCF